MTSNIGSPIIQELGVRDSERTRQRVMEQVQAHFRPEFLNRVDEIILFASLTEAQIKHIVEIQRNLLQKRLADRKLSITLTEAAKDALALSGYRAVEASVYAKGTAAPTLTLLKAA